MGHGFDVLFGWQDRLDNADFRENNSEIELPQGRTRRVVTNQSCSLSGERRGHRVVVTWTDFYVEGFAEDSLPYRDVLDILVREPSIVLEGELRQKAVFDLMLGWVGIHRGWRPTNHPLFKSFTVKRTSSSGTSLLENAAYCDRLLPLLETHQPWKVEYQEGSGVDVFFQAPALTAETLDALVELAIAAASKP